MAGSTLDVKKKIFEALKSAFTNKIRTEEFGSEAFKKILLSTLEQLHALGKSGNEAFDSDFERYTGDLEKMKKALVHSRPEFERQSLSATLSSQSFGMFQQKSRSEDAGFGAHAARRIADSDDVDGLVFNRMNTKYLKSPSKDGKDGGQDSTSCDREKNKPGNVIVE